LAIEGVLNILNNEGCQELSHLLRLAASSDASITHDVPDDMQKQGANRAKVVEHSWAA
jgi:hypothetical protein